MHCYSLVPCTRKIITTCSFLPLYTLYDFSSAPHTLPTFTKLLIRSSSHSFFFKAPGLLFYSNDLVSPSRGWIFLNLAYGNAHGHNLFSCHCWIWAAHFWRLSLIICFISPTWVHRSIIVQCTLFGAVNRIQQLVEKIRQPAIKTVTSWCGSLVPRCQTKCVWAELTGRVLQRGSRQPFYHISGSRARGSDQLENSQWRRTVHVRASLACVGTKPTCQGSSFLELHCFVSV